MDFSHLNLQTDAFPTADGEFRDLDAIFCRNVMIYFSLPTTRKIVDKLAASLVPGGLLVPGPRRDPLQVSSRFERHSDSGGFYYREKKGTRASATAARRRPVPTPEVGLRPAETASGRGYRSLFAGRPAAVQAPAVPEVNELFRKARVLFDAEKYDEAAAPCRGGTPADSPTIPVRWSFKAFSWRTTADSRRH